MHVSLNVYASTWGYWMVPVQPIHRRQIYIPCTCCEIAKVQYSGFSLLFENRCRFDIRLGTFITRSSIPWYCIYHCSNWGRPYVNQGFRLRKNTTNLALMGGLWVFIVRILKKINRVLSVPYCISLGLFGVTVIMDLFWFHRLSC